MSDNDVGSSSEVEHGSSFDESRICSDSPEPAPVASPSLSRKSSRVASSSAQVFRPASLQLVPDPNSKWLFEIQKKYVAYSSFVILPPNPTDRSCINNPSGSVCFMKCSVEGGLVFPLPRFVREVLHHLRLAPAQLNPNAWRVLMGVQVLWRVALDKEIILDEFFYCYVVKKSPGNAGWYYFSCRFPSRLLILELSDSVKDWKDKFFFISGEGWEFAPWELPDRADFPVPRVWAEKIDKILEPPLSLELRDNVKAALAYPARDFWGLVTEESVHEHLFGPAPAPPAVVTAAMTLNTDKDLSSGQGGQKRPPEASPEIASEMASFKRLKKKHSPFGVRKVSSSVTDKAPATQVEKTPASQIEKDFIPPVEKVQAPPRVSQTEETLVPLPEKASASLVQKTSRQRPSDPRVPLTDTVQPTVQSPTPAGPEVSAQPPPRPSGTNSSAALPLEDGAGSQVAKLPGELNFLNDDTMLLKFFREQIPTSVRDSLEVVGFERCRIDFLRALLVVMVKGSGFASLSETETLKEVEVKLGKSEARRLVLEEKAKMADGALEAKTLELESKFKCKLREADAARETAVGDRQKALDRVKQVTAKKNKALKAAEEALKERDKAIKEKKKAVASRKQVLLEKGEVKTKLDRMEADCTGLRASISESVAEALEQYRTGGAMKAAFQEIYAFGYEQCKEHIKVDHPSLDLSAYVVDTEATSQAVAPPAGPEELQDGAASVPK